jgi:hypothetical protein
MATKAELKKKIKQLEQACEDNSKELLLYRTRFGPLKFPFVDVSEAEFKSAEAMGYVPISTPMGEVQYQQNQGVSNAT